VDDGLVAAIQELVDADAVDHPRDVRNARRRIADVIAGRSQSLQGGGQSWRMSEETVADVLLSIRTPALDVEMIRKHAGPIARMTGPSKPIAEPKQANARSEAPLTFAVIEELRLKGYSQADIARMFGVSRQAVSYYKKTYGGRRTARELVNDHFPWSVPHSMQGSPYRRLRDHAEFVATGGDGMSQDKLDRLRAFYRKLREENVVIEFNPLIPPEPGVAKAGGFAFRPRLPRDGDLIIRKNVYTRLTTKGKVIWRLPGQDQLDKL
jgi:hypothetical protein